LRGPPPALLRWWGLRPRVLINWQGQGQDDRGDDITLAALSLIVLLLVGVTGVVYQQIGLRRDARLVPPPGRLVDVDGRRIHVLALGKGTPAVVFESGIAASSLNWATVQREVGRTTAAIAYDRPGFGWSASAPGPADASTACARLRSLLAAVGLAPPYVFVGHSFASYILQIYACRHPGEVAGVVLVDPITHEDWRAPGRDERHVLRGGVLFARIGAVVAASGLLRMLLSRLEGGSAAAGRAVLRSFGSRATTAVTGVVGQVGKMPREVWPAIRAHWSRPRSFLTMARHFQALPESARQVEAALATAPPWTFPLVVLTATQSESQVARHRALAARSRRGIQVTVDGTGHWIHLDAPDSVVAAVNDVLLSAGGEPRLN
jgi:pimeloyl-ACP methyl ester carboxylesterase